MRPRVLTSAVLLILAPLAAAQETFARLQQRFGMQWEQLQRAESPTREQRATLMEQQERELAAFLEQARGDDRWNGRLMLADIRIGRGNRKGALEALAAVDRSEASGMLLLTAAEMAQRLQDKPLRAALVEAAMAQKAPLEERMAMARVLMTLLREVPLGERIFAEALAAAKDDAARAEVRWHQCDAIREREDLEENSYYVALEKLAAELPDTYWGGIARDRLKASKFGVGSPSVPFTATAMDGSAIGLAALAGKPAVLCFLAVLDPNTPELLSLVETVRKEHQDLQVVFVSVDSDAALVAARVKELGIRHPVVCDGRGWMADLALRHHVETAPTLLVLDRGGRIAALNLHGGGRDGQSELREAVGRAGRSP
ncbi:MAG: AhpC/TSA family [Planctomycetota bacterium]